MPRYVSAMYCIQESCASTEYAVGRSLLYHSTVCQGLYPLQYSEYLLGDLSPSRGTLVLGLVPLRMVFQRHLTFMNSTGVSTWCLYEYAHYVRLGTSMGSTTTVRVSKCCSFSRYVRSTTSTSTYTLYVSYRRGGEEGWNLRTCMIHVE